MDSKRTKKKKTDSEETAEKTVSAENQAPTAVSVEAEDAVINNNTITTSVAEVNSDNADVPAAAAGEDIQAVEPSNSENGENRREGEAFRELGLGEQVLRAVIDAGFEAPTPIQAQAIPILLSGNDLIGQAQTGTGKTAAFALPLADRIDPQLRFPQAIILLPTRELCIQVAKDTHDLSRFNKLKVVPVYGGQPIDRQFRALSQGAQIVVGTPGRVLDHLRRGTLDLSQVRFVVLDEADEMLNMGFLEDVEEILKSAPVQRQTALFSATMPPRIAALSKAYLKNPKHVEIESKGRTVEQVTQRYYEVVPSQKPEALARILDMESPGSAIVFCRTRRDVDELGEALQLRGYEAETLHGDMNQAARDRVMARFRSGQAELLIATDVAARGLDIDQVTHVFNYDIPWDVESYIHRIGRTGRAGRTGDAITLISPRERYQLRQIERAIHAPIKAARVPTASDIAVRRREIFKKDMLRALTKDGYDGFLGTVEEIAAEGESDFAQIAAAALQLLWQSQKGGSEYDVSEADALTERAEPGMVRLFLPIGRQDGIRPGDIVGAIANEAGLSGNRIGAIEILERSTFVEVPEPEAQRIIDALGNTRLRGKKVIVDIARPRREEGGTAPEHAEWDERRQFDRGGPGPRAPRPSGRPARSFSPPPRRRAGNRH